MLYTISVPPGQRRLTLASVRATNSDIWETAPVVQVLAGIRASFAKMHPLVVTMAVPEHFAGFAIRNEVWMISRTVDGNPASKAALLSTLLAAHRRELDTTPDRVEARCFIAVLNGRSEPIAVFQQRGQGVVSFPADIVDGAVGDELARLGAFFCGLQN